MSGQVLTTPEIITNRSISQIITKSLFGYLDYVLTPTQQGLWEDILILYGDNGSGKTTILELLFHLLSPAGLKGHRNAIARVPFKSFKVAFSDGTTVTATRAADRLTGAYALIAERAGDRILDCIFDPDAPESGKFSPPNTEKEFLGFLESLDLTMYFLSAERRMTSDLWTEQNVGVRGSMTEEAVYLIRAEHEFILRQHDRSKNLTVKGKTTESALRMAAQWIRAQAVRATNIGSENTNTIYTDIIKRIAESGSTASANASQSVEQTTRKLNDLSRRTEAFARFGFTPIFPVDETVRSIRQVGSDNQGVLSSVLEPFINSMSARLDALEELQRITAIFVGRLESFFQNKFVSFTLGNGFVITSPTGQQLEASWLSSGEQQLLVLLCYTLVARDTPSIFMVDEPEISLNVKWQRQLLSALLEVVAGARVQFVFATHSLEILSEHQDRVLKLEQLNGGRIGAKDSH